MKNASESHDSQFAELTNDISLISPQVFEEKWGHKIGTFFNIGCIRELIRKGSPEIKKVVASSLFKEATTAEKAERALSSWAYYSISERQRLIGTVVASTERTAGNAVAYLLSRLNEVWARTNHTLIELPERALLVSYLVRHVDGEHAQLALRWSHEYGHTFTPREEQTLSTIPTQTQSGSL